MTDLGRDVPVERFVDEAVHRKADIIAISTMMTTTMPNMRKVVRAWKEGDCGTKLKFWWEAGLLPKDLQTPSAPIAIERTGMRL